MNILKKGDTLDISLRLYDEFKKAPIIIDESIEFNASVKDLYGNILSIPLVVLYDQISHSGWIRITTSSLETAAWPLGRGNLEIKFIVDGSIVISTQTIQFLIERPVNIIGDKS